jgi:hypothetical protein
MGAGGSFGRDDVVDRLGGKEGQGGGLVNNKP